MLLLSPYTCRLNTHVICRVEKLVILTRYFEVPAYAYDKRDSLDVFYLSPSLFIPPLQPILITAACHYLPPAASPTAPSPSSSSPNPAFPSPPRRPSSPLQTAH